MTKPSLLAVGVVCLTAAALFVPAQVRSADQSRAQSTATVTVKRNDFIRGVRLAGTVEAVEATSIAAPRLAGQNQN